jgi:tetratricopeptide (TPR) repeat protein
MAGQSDIQAAAALHTAGRLDEAEQAYKALLAKEPRNPDLLNLYGALIGQKGDLAESIRLIGEAIALKPDDPSYYWNLATAQAALGNIVAALQIYLDLGNAHLKQGRFDEALATYEQGLRVAPENPQLATNAGVVLGKLHRWDEAIERFSQALKHTPDFVPAMTNRGNALWGKYDFDAAMADYRRAVALDAANPYAQLNYAYAVHQRGGDLDEAMRHYEQAILLNPDFAKAHFDYGQLLLSRARFAEGFAELEWRWHASYEYKEPRRPYRQPVWRGESAGALNGTLLLIPEQGYGDHILLARYVRPLAEQGYDILLEAHPALHRLFRQSFAGEDRIEVALRKEIEAPVPWYKTIWDKKASRRFAAFTGMMSLPHRLHDRLGAIPGVPYLSVDPSLIEQWKQRIARLPTGTLKVGIAWSGDPRPGDFEASRVDSQRSLKPEQLTILNGLKGITFVSLQKGATAAAGKAYLANTDFVDFMDEAKDFADTAALMHCLDLIVSVDTSVANLAGALALPLWVLLRRSGDWRWLDTGNISPWFHTARLFRQRTVGDWQPVLNELAAALSDFSASGTAA